MPDARWATPVVGQLTRCEGGGPANHNLRLSRLEKLKIVDFQGTGKLIDCDDGWVSLPILQPANILLAKSRKLGEPLLS